jgi:phenylalanyl-tRNA synthetase alpha subunit
MTIQEFQTACTAIEQEYKDKISQAATLAEVEDLRVAALGRKGALTELLKGLKDFSIEEKKQAGPLGNALKAALTAALDEKTAFFAEKEINEELNKTEIDLTLPGYPVAQGHRHPLSRRLDNPLPQRTFRVVGQSRPRFRACIHQQHMTSAGSGLSRLCTYPSASSKTDHPRQCKTHRL